MVIGTVQNIVKRMQMNNQWMQKEDDKKKKKEDNKNLTPEMRQLLQYEEDMKQIREQRPKADIDAKLKAGAELSTEEIEYLKKNDPDAYREYEEIKREKENYKKQLKNCKTKEDVEKLKLNKMGQFMAETKGISQNPNIPKAKKLGLMEKILKKIMGINAVHIAFTKTTQYQNLPTEEEKKEEEAKKKEATQPDIITEEIKTQEIEVQTPEEEKNIEQTDSEHIVIVEHNLSKKQETLKETKVTETIQELPADFEETKAIIINEISRLSPARNYVKK